MCKAFLTLNCNKTPFKGRDVFSVDSKYIHSCMLTIHLFFLTGRKECFYARPSYTQVLKIKVCLTLDKYYCSLELRFYKLCHHSDDYANFNKNVISHNSPRHEQFQCNAKWGHDCTHPDAICNLKYKSKLIREFRYLG